jgi:hypothetical protein
LINPGIRPDEVFSRGNMGKKGGAPGVTRTPDLLIRSQTLYPTELRARKAGKARII